MTSLNTNLKDTTVTLGTFRKRLVLTTTTKHSVQRETPAMGLDNQRIRFNWGYHDGASTLRNNFKTEQEIAEFVANHFDRAYSDGFAAGVRDQSDGRYTNNSQIAWQTSGRIDDFQGWRA